MLNSIKTYWHPHLLYWRYLLRHKWFVFQAGLVLAVPVWRLIIHDWSKFLPCEWIPYVEYFYGERIWPTKLLEELAQHRIEFRFNRAWLHHLHHNPHHWQHWILRNDDGTDEALRMPIDFVHEMVADWVGAGLAIGKPDVVGWYVQNHDLMLLHPQTRAQVEVLLRLFRQAVEPRIQPA